MRPNNCSHPNNKIIEEKITWLKIEHTIAFKKKPRVINANNNCSWYEFKGIKK